MAAEVMPQVLEGIRQRLELVMRDPSHPSHKPLIFDEHRTVFWPILSSDSLSPLNCNGSSLFLTARTVEKENRPVNDELYDDYILDHYECPYHKGHIECPTCTHSEKNPLCGDQIRLELKVDDQGKVAEAFFNGKGCAISQAAASILCKHVEGKSLDELRGFQAPDMLRLLKVPLTATRQRCGLLGFKVLKTLMYSLEQPPAATDEPVAASSG